MKTVVFDCETTKVPAPEGWPYSRRTKVILVGYGWWDAKRKFVTGYNWGDEKQLIPYINGVFRSFDLGVYVATRDYDRLVLEGRWTYARRGPNPTPGDWPHVMMPDRWWKNIRKDLKNAGIEWRKDRSWDIKSKDVPDLWAAGDRKAVVRHCLADVTELAKAYSLLVG